MDRGLRAWKSLAPRPTQQGASRWKCAMLQFLQRSINLTDTAVCAAMQGPKTCQLAPHKKMLTTSCHHLRSSRETCSLLMAILFYFCVLHKFGCTTWHHRFNFQLTANTFCFCLSKGSIQGQKVNLRANWPRVLRTHHRHKYFQVHKADQ